MENRFSIFWEENLWNEIEIETENILWMGRFSWFSHQIGIHKKSCQFPGKMTWFFRQFETLKSILQFPGKIWPAARSRRVIQKSFQVSGKKMAGYFWKFATLKHLRIRIKCSTIKSGLAMIISEMFPSLRLLPKIPSKNFFSLSKAAAIIALYPWSSLRMNLKLKESGIRIRIRIILLYVLSTY